MTYSEIPRVDYAIIGGSSTFSLNFPQDLDFPDVMVIAEKLVFPTPYGESPPLKLFIVGGKKVLTVKMHGWRQGVSRGRASQQLFWVLQKAGVKKILSEGGVGAINHLLKPRDILIPSDYLDFSMRKDVSLGGEFLLSMRQPVCPILCNALFRAAEKKAPEGGRVFDRGIYAVTDGRHFESPAEVAMLGRLGADIVGQSMCPEVYLAREIGACYGRVDIVTNYAEGVNRDWEHSELADIFYQEAHRMGSILLEAIRHINTEGECGCAKLRYPTLLKEYLPGKSLP
ncbi:MTAP family purine nucleoside phosphorylase [Desulfofundulus thermocisternus]|uniref:MTAP family purine nucleoside phosphorylase n=1 Tax=Desulfofundulus thermocisternus TaxID=42471 RepID=UPI00217F01C5|nr:MTAP family purine nucleoside phosphorylase [Desulfofundulus thermocisternus]MCS5695841.1 MTAP family purine nucleoside phosphorylase [Desulfofundulus thermocisternus]